MTTTATIATTTAGDRAAALSINDSSKTKDGIDDSDEYCKYVLADPHICDQVSSKARSPITERSNSLRLPSSLLWVSLPSHKC